MLLVGVTEAHGKPGDVRFGGGKPCSLAFAFRVDRFPDGDGNAWNDQMPMSLLRLDAASADEPTVFVRVRPDRNNFV